MRIIMVLIAVVAAVFLFMSIGPVTCLLSGEAKRLGLVGESVFTTVALCILITALEFCLYYLSTH